MIYRPTTTIDRLSAVYQNNSKNVLILLVINLCSKFNSFIMPQGKFKKAKMPAAIQNKKKQQKQAAFTRRSNAPIQAKKGKFNETQKIKAVISKSVNKSVESELRSRAHEGYIQLSKAQEAVAKHHATKAAAAAAASTSKAVE